MDVKNVLPVKNRDELRQWLLDYQRVRIDTIQIKKRQPELFQSRLQKFLENTRAGVMYGEWNDNGRLLTE